VLFSGGAGPILHARALAVRLFTRGVQYGEDIPGAVDWLLKLLTTRKATILFKAAIWGISLDGTLELASTSRLMPFAALPDSYMKNKISERARPCYDKSIWMAQNYYDKPVAAYLEEVADFPYIGTDGACFRIMNDLVEAAHELGVLIQAACVGYPLAIACWFECADRDLEYAEWENMYDWLLPEIPPHIKSCQPLDAEVV
jgi:hypothetical protein